jgi:hypothetical protein
MSYEDDEYTYVHYDDDDNVPQYPDAVSEYSAVSSNRKRQRRNRDEMKKADKGYHCITRKVDYKLVNIELYATKNSPGTMIRDAILGTRYNEYLVGSISEHLFYKVKIATGEVGQDAGVFFYDSPDQYEKHFKYTQTVPNEAKEEWSLRRAIVQKRLERREDATVAKEGTGQSTTVK